MRQFEIYIVVISTPLNLTHPLNVTHPLNLTTLLNMTAHISFLTELSKLHLSLQFIRSLLTFS
jgi:hypothetical protein